MTEAAEFEWPTPPEGRLLDRAKSAWDRKEAGVKEIDDDFDITSMLTLYRGEHALADIMCPNVSRDEALAAATMTAPLMQADCVIVSLDCHITTEMNNPRTGKPWGPNEMQNLCNNEGACDLGIITDTIVTIEAIKDGPIRQISRRYHVNHAAREVHWVDDGNYGTTETEGQEFRGVVPETLRQALSRPGPDMTTEDALEIARRDGIQPHEMDVNCRIAAAHLTVATVECAMLLYAIEPFEKEFIDEASTPEAMEAAMERLAIPAMLMRLKFGLADEAEKAGFVAALTGSKP